MGAVADVKFGRVFFVAEGEEAGFEGAETVEAPLMVGKGLGELGFDGAFGLKVADEGAGEGEVLLQVFAGEDDDLGGEAVAECVEGGTFFTGVGAGAGGILRVAAIGGDLQR